jgi:hypothetical protein
MVDATIIAACEPGRIVIIFQLQGCKPHSSHPFRRCHIRTACCLRSAGQLATLAIEQVPSFGKSSVGPPKDSELNCVWTPIVLTDVINGTVMVNLDIQSVLAISVRACRPSFQVTATEGIRREPPYWRAEVRCRHWHAPGLGVLFTPPSLVSAWLVRSE